MAGIAAAPETMYTESFTAGARINLDAFLPKITKILAIVRTAARKISMWTTRATLGAEEGHTSLGELTKDMTSTWTARVMAVLCVEMATTLPLDHAISVTQVNTRWLGKLVSFSLLA